MTAFLIDPEIRVRHRRYPVLRTIADALALARGMAAEHPGTVWPGTVRLLERIRTEEDALEAAVEIEMLLESDAMLIPDTERPASIPAPWRAPAQVPQPASTRVVSTVFATAPAAPSR